MSATDTFRDAVFGNPPSPTTEPSREGALAAFNELEREVLAAVTGVKSYATKPLLVADTTQAYGTLAYVYKNNGSTTDPANGFYQWDTTNTWVPAPWVISGLSDALALLGTSHFADLYRNLWPATVSFGPGDLCIDAANMYGGGKGIYLPLSIEIRRGDQIIGAAPVGNAQSAYRGGHAFLAYDPSQTTAVWFDERDNQYHYNAIGYLTDAITTAYANIVPLGIFPVGSDVIHAPVPWRRSTDYVGKNSSTWGADVTQAPYQTGGVASATVTSTDLLNMGMNNGLRAPAPADLSAGGNFASVRGGRLFLRVYVESTVANSFGAVGANIWERGVGDGYIGTPLMQLERIFSPTVRSYTLCYELPGDRAAGSFNALVNKPTGTGNLTIAGIQVAVSDTIPPRFVRHGDFAVASVNGGAGALPVVGPADLLVLTGDSRTNSGYAFIEPTWASRFGCRVSARGQSGHTVAQNASNADWAQFFPTGGEVPRLVGFLPGGNDSLVSFDSVGTFSADSPNGKGGAPVVGPAPVADDFNATTYPKFIQAIDHYCAKFDAMFANFRARAGLTGSETEDQKNAKIAAVVRPILFLMTDLPQNRGGDTRTTDPAMLERKRQAIIEVARKWKLQIVDTAGELYWSTDREPAYPTSPEGPNQGLNTLDGLHPNQFGQARISELAAMRLGVSQG